MSNIRQPSPPTARVVEVVEFLGDRTGDTFTSTEIARHLGTNRSTTLAILRTLVATGWATVDRHGRYGLGPGLIAVGEAARSSSGLIDVARAEMRSLADELGLEAMGAVPAGDRLVVAVTVGGDGVHRIMRVGQSLPMAPPFGMVVVAFAPDEEVERWLDRAPTPLRAGERKRYRSAVAAVRARGFSATLDIDTRRRLGETLAELAEHPASSEARTRRDALVAALAHDRYVLSDLPEQPALPISQISAPVFASDGRVVLVLGVQGFPHQFAPGQLAEIAGLIVATADRITSAHGGRRPANGPGRDARPGLPS
jgi:DNA-binding IclR family transcriptional regulator